MKAATCPLVLLVFLLHSPGAKALQPQAATEVTPEPACAGCVIELRRIATLGDDAGEGVVGFTSMVVTAGAHIFVVHHGAVGKVLVFGKDGSFIRELGTGGDGQAMFRRISGLSVGPGDSLHVFDKPTATVSVFSPALTLVRTSPFIVALQENSAFVRSDGVVVLNGPSPVGTTRGSVLHILETNGSIGRSWDVPHADSNSPNQAGLRYRWMTSSADGGFWVAHYATYRMEERDRAGELLRVLQGVPPWFVRSNDVGRDESHAGGLSATVSIRAGYRRR